MENKRAAIEVTHLSKAYKLYAKPMDRLKEALHPKKKQYHQDFYALHDVSFTVEKGETVGIIGKNGSGKSTLLKIITGVLSPLSGEVRLDGKVSALLELGAGFNPEFTGMENIYLNGMVMGYTREEIGEKLEGILQFADIGDFIHQPVKIYSSGMFVKLAFAVAINIDPEILIVDEALAVGDARFQIKCMQKFDEFQKSGKTILFVSHDINSVKKFCSKAIWLNDGKVKLSGATDFVTDEYTSFLRGKTTQSLTPQLIAEKKDLIGWIEAVTILDEQDREVDVVEHGQRIRIKIDYYIADEIVDEIVVGVAIYRDDNLYVCGLNTMLDEYRCHWQKGHNTIWLAYERMDLTGGNYYFNVAVFEKTAHVAIEYKTAAKRFFVKMPYIGEGVCLLKHTWKEDMGG